jgi:hypothetical protein
MAKIAGDQQWERALGVAGAAAASVSPLSSFTPLTGLTFGRSATTVVEAYQAYLEGKHYAYEITPAGMAKSLNAMSAPSG